MTPHARRHCVLAGEPSDRVVCGRMSGMPGRSHGVRGEVSAKCVHSTRQKMETACRGHFTFVRSTTARTFQVRRLCGPWHCPQDPQSSISIPTSPPSVLDLRLLQHQIPPHQRHVSRWHHAPSRFPSPQAGLARLQAASDHDCTLMEFTPGQRRHAPAHLDGSRS